MVWSLGPDVALGKSTLSALKRARGPPGRGAGGAPGPPPSSPTHSLWSGLGWDVPFWRMPPLIPNNAPAGPAGTSLVCDVVRSEPVPRREVERGPGTRALLARGDRFTAGNKAFLLLFLLLIYNNSIKMRREGRAQGLEHPQMPTYLLPVVAGTVGSLPGGDGHSATTRGTSPSPPKGPGAVAAAGRA